MTRPSTSTRARPGRRRPTQAGRRRPRRALALAGAVVLAVIALAVISTATREAADRDGPFVGGDLHSLVADPTTPGRLFVGGHEAVATSTDGGATWRAVPSLRGADAMGWAFAAGEEVWVSGHPGVYRSNDGGRTFRRRNQALPDTDVHAFGAGAGMLYGASPAVGLFASTDGGVSWEVRSQHAGSGFFARILVDGAEPGHLIAADARAGVVESRDGGRTWRRLGGVPGATWVSRTGPRMTDLVASGAEGAALSRDGGNSWQPLVLPREADMVEASPSAPDLLYAAGLSGSKARVWVSRDGGRRWSPR